MSEASIAALDGGSPNASDAIPLVEFQGVGYEVCWNGVRRKVLEDVTLAVTKGEFLAIVGRSGAGKTTILNMISGFVSPTEGVLRIQTGLLERDRSVGYMFARDALLPWRTAVRNVELALEPQSSQRNRKSQRTRRELAMEALSSVGMSYAAFLLPRQLSQGMRQRVALARTLVTEPRLLLLDEPFAALDVSIRGDLQAFTRELYERGGLTIILVTHDLREALSSASRVVILDGEPARVQVSIDVNTVLGRERDIRAIQDEMEFVELHRQLRARMTKSAHEEQSNTTVPWVGAQS